MISIIIPILNEKKYIGKLLRHLLMSSSQKNSIEIIVVDGGSTDGSQKIVSNFEASSNTPKYLETYKLGRDMEIPSQTILHPKILLLQSKKGRAKQMNFGAKHASGSILYFLHADSLPPNDFDQLISHEVTKGKLGGCFRMQFDSHHWWLKIISWFTKFPWSVCRGGDQSLFIEKQLFQELGGYDVHYLIYEDNVLTKKLCDLNQFKVIQKPIKTSARLFEKHGVWRLQYHFIIIHLKYWLGADADELFQYYKHHIR